MGGINNRFIIGLPRTMKKHDYIMVIVSKLSKEDNFIHVKSIHTVVDIGNIFMKEIFTLHGVPNTFFSNRDAKFTSNFWKIPFEYLSTKMKFSNAYHPPENWQTKRVNQVIEDKLHMYVMDKSFKWEGYLNYGVCI